MSKNFKGEGRTISYTNSSGDTLAAGVPIELGGGRIVVPIGDIANGAAGEVWAFGEWDLPKDTTVIGAGVAIKITADNKISVGSAGTTINNAYPIIAANSAATTVRVKIL